MMAAVATRPPPDAALHGARPHNRERVLQRERRGVRPVRPEPVIARRDPYSIHDGGKNLVRAVTIGFSN